MGSAIKSLIEKSPDPQLMEAAFEFANSAYEGEPCLGTEQYLSHAERVALMLGKMGLDQKTIIAGLLHNAANKPDALLNRIILEDIKKKFGKDIAELVESISYLNKVYRFIVSTLKDSAASNKERVENLRKMFFAIEKDMRAIVINLVARIDRMEHIASLPEEERKSNARETLQIHAPIANRLGLGGIKARLEDLSFALLMPNKFRLLKEEIKEQYEERESYLAAFIPKLKNILAKENIIFLDINCRAKSYWSTYQKLLKKGMDLGKVHDLVALRVIVPDIEACYKTLGIIHTHYRPISEEINDYIAKPKPNGYKSLHTTVFLDEEKISEIQIRTSQMHKEAEYGICAHWSYKEKIDLSKEQEYLKWTKGIPEFQKTYKIDFFENQVFAFTPRGDIISLPKGSTPIDFAYAIHSEIGNHCEFAKIGGKITPLSEALRTGDVVEIITNKRKKPSLDWLKFVKTSFARSNIRKATSAIVQHTIFSVPSLIKKKLLRISFGQIKERSTAMRSGPVKKEKSLEIYIGGQRGIMVHIAKCCLPQPSDEAKAYLTKYKAAVLHKVSCANMQRISQKFPEKIIDAAWHES